MTSETLITAAANHLWQSTAFAAVAALVTLALRNNDARTRYRVWLAASLKFMAPFAVLAAMGAHLKTPAHPVVSPSRLLLIEQIGQPFGTAVEPHAALRPAASVAAGMHLPVVLFVLWLGGALFVLIRWLARWRRAACLIRQAHPITEGAAAETVRRLAERAGVRTPVRIVSSRAPLEPGVFGWLRPVLFLPEGIEKHLSAEQLESVIAHEISHVQRRDNLFAAIQALVEAVFWFHPLVWWIGARLLEERERACDEEVLAGGSQPVAYAEGILRTCRLYLESPAPCMSGVTGADLKERIVRITSQIKARNLGPGQKALLALAAVLAVTAPIIFGLLRAPAVRAQSQAASAPQGFEVASIKPGDPSSRNTFVNITPGGGFRASNINLKFLIRVAYHVQDFQVSGGPAWMSSDRYDVDAKSSDGASVDIHKMSEAQRDEFQKRIELKLQGLLAERFKLTIHRESKDVPIYELVIAKNGPKLIAVAADDGKRQRGMRMRPGQFEGMGATLPILAQTLSDATGRKVIDKTGLAGNYDFKLDWTPEPGQMAPPPGGEPEPVLPPPDANGPSIFTAVQEQLGLRLESAKGPVEMIVIDRVQKPSAN
jgi:bla regulator protein blaR1